MNPETDLNMHYTVRLGELVDSGKIKLVLDEKFVKYAGLNTIEGIEQEDARVQIYRKLE